MLAPPGRKKQAAALAFAAFLVISADPVQAQPRDPALVWRTLDTPHFTIYYHEPLALMARRLAAVAERAHAAAAEVMGYEADRRTHLVLSDDSDFANGDAIAIPYNVVHLFASAPSSMSPLGDYDDWINMLVVHEHTHIVHLDQWSGIATLINLLLGKVYAPNHIQPRWVLEGVATWQESERTAGGRLRSTMFDMYLRMDALENRFFDIDQISTFADRWPHGNVWYLYGSQFIAYIANRYGREAIATMSRAYGDSTLPWGLNRVAEEATGHSFVDLYASFLADRRRHYEAQRDSVIARGRVEGERITFHGEVARLPRFTRDGRVTYWRDDGRSRRRIVAFDLDRPDAQESWVRVSGDPGYALHPSGHVVYFTRTDNYRDIYMFHDLFRCDLETGRTDRLTHGMRAREPDISPDGRRVVFTVNGAGTAHLMIAETRDVEGSARRLVESPRYGQVFDPRFSPDGRTIAFSRWERGGYRDVLLVDVESGRITPLTHDRAQDASPVWASDGRTLYFSSDRSGIANIYAYHLPSGLLQQVTNVVAGAYQPAISPDGNHLVYVGYTSYGFDLFHLDLRRSEMRPAEPYVDLRPAPVDDEDIYAGLSREYQPLETLWPRSYMVDLTNDGFGTAIGVTVEGQDLAGWHHWFLRGTVGTVRGNMNVDLDYEYRRSPLTFGAHFFRREAPRRGLFIQGEDREWVEHAIGGDLRLSYSMPASFHGQNVSLAWRGGYVDAAEPFEGRLDPNDPPPRLPELGPRSELRLGWSYSNTERYTYDISTQMGTALGFTIALDHPVIGSPFTQITLTWFLRQYLPMPFIDHHVLALNYSGGIAGGDFGRRDTFSVGGFGETSFIDVLINNAVLGGVALRGYPAFDRSGTQYHLLQAEYRFPIWRINRGVLTLPIYLNRLHATVFTDVGDAFSGNLDFSTFRVGVGAQLMLDFTIGYILSVTLRVGYARGLMEGGIDQFYGHLGVPF